MILQNNISLRNQHTFGVEAYARDWTEARSLEDWNDVVAYKQAHPQTPVLVLGEGSNLLFTKDVAGLVVKNALKGIEVVDEDAETVRLRVAGGENWHQFVLWTIERGYWGLENLSLIPGTVGAAPIQNIGAYGVEIKDWLEEVEALDLATGAMRRFSLDACRFGYRDSVFKNDLKGKYALLYVTFRLSKLPKPNLRYADIEASLHQQGIQQPTQRDISNTIIQIRQQKLPNPAEIGNAGSFFKNPIISKRHFQELQEEFPQLTGHAVSETQVKISAAWLVEKAGWKGKRVGDAGVYARHALVLVNHGNATGREIQNLAFEILDSVRQKFNIVIIPEVNML